MSNSVKSRTSKECLIYSAWNDETMINTNDLKVFNNNFEQKFDVIIQGNNNSDGKRDWIIKVKMQDKPKTQELYTYAGHKRLFKNLEFCLKFVEEYCSNANDIFIVFDSNGMDRTVTVLDSAKTKINKG